MYEVLNKLDTIVENTEDNRLTYSVLTNIHYHSEKENLKINIKEIDNKNLTNLPGILYLFLYMT